MIFDTSCMNGGFEVVHLYRTVHQFFREWPNVGDVVKPCYTRAYEAGLIATPPGEATGEDTRWRSGPCLTYTGGLIKQLTDASPQNYFRFEDVLEPWAASHVATHGRGPGVFWNYCKLFGIDPLGEDVEAWLRKTIEPEYLQSPMYADKLAWLTRVDPVSIVECLSHCAAAQDRLYGLLCR